MGAFFFSRLVVSDFVTPWTAARQPSLSFTISQSLLKPLSGNAYICVRGHKSGVYNTQAKKMVINIEYDSIEISQNGALIVSKNGVHSKLTTEGYRIIE